jgi:hypothetical protein
MVKRTHLNTSVKVLFKDNSEKIYKSIESASKDLQIEESTIIMRANKKNFKGFPKFEWVDSKTKRSFQARKSKRKGSSWEYELIKQFKALGYDDCVTSRSESKNLDNNKIDICSNTLPVYVQAKHTTNIPNYFKIESECPLKDKPFVICWKKANESKKELALIPIELFYKLLKQQNKYE